MSEKTIEEKTLRALIAANSVHAVTATGRKGGFAVAIRHGTAEHELATARHGVRVFPNLTRLAVFLAKLGVQRFEVDTAEYEPGRVRKPRPDRALALRHTRTQPRQASMLLEGS